MMSPSIRDLTRRIAILILAIGLVLLAACSSSDSEDLAHPKAAYTADPQIVFPDPSIDSTQCPALLVEPNDRTPRCSAVAVGDHVVLTAKHCVSSSGEIEVSFKKGSAKTWGSKRCERLEFPDVDFAICGFDKTFPGTHIKEIDGFSTPIAVSDAVIISGFGCTKKPCAPNPVFKDAKQRSGRAQVWSIANPHFFVRGTTSSPSSLCVGDSGGPMCRDDGPAGLVGIGVANCLNGVSSDSVAVALNAQPVKDHMCSWNKQNTEFIIPGIDC